MSDEWILIDRHDAQAMEGSSTSFQGSRGGLAGPVTPVANAEIRECAVTITANRKRLSSSSKVTVNNLSRTRPSATMLLVSIGKGTMFVIERAFNEELEQT